MLPRTIEITHPSIVQSALVSAALTIKHGGFAEEAEWRLIDNSQEIQLLHLLSDDSGDPLKLRRGAFGITPYFDAKLPDTFGGFPFGITSVTVGPSTNSAAIVSSISELLRIKYKSKAEVGASVIPYRAS
jgi:hypothetical protein